MPGRLRRLDRPAVRVEPAHPVHLDERLAQQEFSGRAIEHIVVAVAIRPQQRLQRRALQCDVREHRHLYGVVVVAIVRRELVVPPQPPGVGVERHDRGRVKVVAGPLIVAVVGADVAGAPVGQIQIGIVGSGDPDRSAAVFPRLRIAIVVRLGGHCSQVSCPGSPGPGTV